MKQKRSNIMDNYTGWTQVFGNNFLAQQTVEYFGAVDVDDFVAKTIAWSKCMWKDEHSNTHAEQAARDCWKEAKE